MGHDLLPVKGWDSMELSKLHFTVENHSGSEMHDKEWYVNGTWAVILVWDIGLGFRHLLLCSVGER